jgi:HAD superfamily hydrolase (TIGR01509 family)
VIPGDELAALLAGRRLLVFDFDGTIADSSPLHEAAFRAVLEPLGIAVDYPRLAGRSTRDALRLSYALNQQPEPDAALIDELALRKQELGRELIRTGLSALPAAEALLRWSRPRFPLALVTSGSRATIDISLDRLGMAGWFDPLITADDVTQAKPDPQGFLLALDRSQVPASEALVFEDAESGFEAARRAGIDWVDARQLGQMLAAEG